VDADQPKGLSLTPPPLRYPSSVVNIT